MHRHDQPRIGTTFNFTFSCTSRWIDIRRAYSTGSFVREVFLTSTWFERNMLLVYDMLVYRSEFWEQRSIRVRNEPRQVGDFNPMQILRETYKSYKLHILALSFASLHLHEVVVGNRCMSLSLCSRFSELKSHVIMVINVINVISSWLNVI